MNRQTHSAQYVVIRTWMNPRMTKEDTQHTTFAHVAGTEFGYDDASRAHAQLRDDWIKNGMVWWSSYVEPRSRWNPLAQLKNAGFK